MNCRRSPGLPQTPVQTATSSWRISSRSVERRLLHSL